MQIKCTVSKRRKVQYEQAADRGNLMSLGAWLYQAAEEKLQRECPDLYKQK